MKIDHISLYPYQIPLRAPFITAHHTLTQRSGAIIQVHTQDGIVGNGEITPLPGFTSYTLQDALSPLPALIKQLVGKRVDEALADLLHIRASLPPATVSGLELALLDALGKTQQRALHTLLITPGTDTDKVQDDVTIAQRSAIRVNAVIGAQALESAVRQAQEAIARGFSCIKLKVGSDAKTDFERITAVREAVGPEVHVRLDANEGWSFAQAHEILSRCAHLAIQYVEQPLRADDLAGMSKLRQAVPVAIAADEALHDLVSARRILAAGAADILIVKPQFAGGLYSGRQIIHEAAEQGVQCVITSAIGTGIGLAGDLHLAAASPEVSLACGLATLHMLVDDLIIEDLAIHNGFLTIPNGPGLGVRLDNQALAHYNHLYTSNT